MEKTWKPVVAGVLDIVSGAVGLIVVFGLIIAILVTGGCVIPGTAKVPLFVPSLLTGIAVPLAIFSMLSLAGGIYALQRKLWGLAPCNSEAYKSKTKSDHR